jgi:hypothetical protein
MYLYLMGRGHSGSTVLDIALGNAAAVESVGELAALGAPRWRSGEIPCSCGAPVDGCPFWREVRRRFEAAGGGDWGAAAEALYAHGHVRNFWRTLRADPDPAGAPADLAALARAAAALRDAMAAASGKPHVLDSSKEPTRALLLLKYLPGDARVVHLVRDPRGIARSHHWRIADGRGFLFLRRRFRATWTGPLFLLLGAASWTAGNLLAELVACRHPDRVLRLRYEDLRRDPAAAVRLVGSAFGLPVEDAALRLERGEALAVGHNVGGNHIRHERGGVRFDAGAEAARPPLPRWAELATLALCWPLMGRYGYPLRPAPAAAGGPPATPGAEAAGRTRSSGAA